MTADSLRCLGSPPTVVLMRREIEHPINYPEPRQNSYEILELIAGFGFWGFHSGGGVVIVFIST